MASRFIADRRLPERAKLSFYFPNAEEGSNYILVHLPFFENPKIREKKRARYQKYSLISRSSNLYSYLGADSRRFSLTFNITLPHILEDYPNVTVDQYIVTPKLDTNWMKKEAFKGPNNAIDNPGMQSLRYAHDFFTIKLKETAQQVLNSEWGRYGISPAEMDYLKTLYGLEPEVQDNDFTKLTKSIISFPGSLITDADESIPEPFAKEGDEDPVKSLSDSTKKKFTIIDVIVYWINIIRSSVVNSAENPMLGPPVIRLSHGLMYQNIPCICNDYSLEWDERAGYDLETLLPRRLKVSLNLDEFRTGNFGVFNQNSSVENDNLAGWESVIGEPGTMDPGYIGHIKPDPIQEGSYVDTVAPGQASQMQMPDF